MAIKGNTGILAFAKGLWLCGIIITFVSLPPISGESSEDTTITTSTTPPPGTTTTTQGTTTPPGTTKTTQGTTTTTSSTTKSTTTTTTPPPNTTTSAILTSPSTTTVTRGQTTTTPSEQYPVFQGSEYLFRTPDSPETFESALNNCTDWGGSLVSILSEEENEFVRSLLANETDGDVASWIGLQQDEDGNYTWTDGSPFNYTNFATNISSINCAVIESSDGKWLNVTCETLEQFFTCKRAITTTAPETDTTDSGPNNEDNGTSGLSDSAVIAVSIALILVVIALSLAAVTYFIKKKRKPKQDTFTLLDNEQADFVTTNTVTIDDSY